MMVISDSIIINNNDYDLTINEYSNIMNVEGVINRKHISICLAWHSKDKYFGDSFIVLRDCYDKYYMEQAFWFRLDLNGNEIKYRDNKTFESTCTENFSDKENTDVYLEIVKELVKYYKNKMKYKYPEFKIE